MYTAEEVDKFVNNMIGCKVKFTFEEYITLSHVREGFNFGDAMIYSLYKRIPIYVDRHVLSLFNIKESFREHIIKEYSNQQKLWWYDVDAKEYDNFYERYRGLNSGLPKHITSPCIILTIQFFKTFLIRNCVNEDVLIKFLCLENAVNSYADYERRFNAFYDSRSNKDINDGESEMKRKVSRMG